VDNELDLLATCVLEAKKQLGVSWGAPKKIGARGRPAAAVSSIETRNEVEYVLHQGTVSTEAKYVHTARGRA
jgi:hypothetical protein